MAWPCTPILAEGYLEHEALVVKTSSLMAKLFAGLQLLYSVLSALHKLEMVTIVSYNHIQYVVDAVTVTSMHLLGKLSQLCL